MDHSLWSVLLKLVNNKIPTPPQEWDEKGEAIFAIEQMAGTSNPQKSFQALDSKTQSTVLDILTTVRLEHDHLNHQRWALSLSLEARSDLEKQNIRGFVEQKIRLLNPLLNLSKAIQPTPPFERFLKITADLMAHLSDQDRKSLDRALFDCVHLQTGR